MELAAAGPPAPNPWKLPPHSPHRGSLREQPLFKIYISFFSFSCVRADLLIVCFFSGVLGKKASYLQWAGYETEMNADGESRHIEVEVHVNNSLRLVNILTYKYTSS